MAFLTRHQLYVWVWTEATPVIAKELTFSAPWVRSFCDRHDIPHPKRGFWRRHETGHVLRPPPLPLPESNPTFDLQISDSRAEELEQLWVDLQAGGQLTRRRTITPSAPAATPQTRFCPDSGLAGPPSGAARHAPKPLRADAATLAQLAKHHERVVAQNRFLDDLQRTASEHDALTAAWVASWISAARADRAIGDPIGQVIAWCAQAARSSAESLVAPPTAPDVPDSAPGDDEDATPPAADP